MKKIHRKITQASQQRMLNLPLLFCFLVNKIIKTNKNFKTLEVSYSSLLFMAMFWGNSVILQKNRRKTSFSLFANNVSLY